MNKRQLVALMSTILYAVSKTPDYSMEQAVENALLICDETYYQMTESREKESPESFFI